MIVKVCGITRPADVDACATAGVRWIGLNLWPQSPRHVALDAARTLAGQARDAGMEPVAILVRPSADEVDAAWAGGDFAMLQLYEPQAPVPADVAWIRPVRVQAEAPIELGTTSARYDLIEAHVPQIGGAGVRFDWARLRGLSSPRPFLVAGGITPDNVGELLALVRPAGIDVASGVEGAPGVKDSAKIRTLMAAVHHAERTP